VPDLINRIILCIDDNEDVTACLERCLHDRGYTVLTASNGAQGLELFAVHPVDVVIVDGHMPGMEGHQVASEIRRTGLPATIIMFSGEESVPSDTLKLVDAFVCKGRIDSLPCLIRSLENLLSKATVQWPGRSAGAIQPDTQATVPRSVI
jgi:CheY-like chemotaxis protein